MPLGGRSNLLGKLSQLFVDNSSRLIRGYTPDEKIKRAQEIALTPEVLGLGPESLGDVSPEAERYAGQSLAAESGRPQWGANLFNTLALAGLGQSPEERARVRRAGDIGYITGHNRSLGR